MVAVHPSAAPGAPAISGAPSVGELIGLTVLVAMIMAILMLMRMLLEIKRTGDIFFPKRWADATLSGYQTSDVADDVRGFIDALPKDYPPRLRWVLLSSADPLFRAATLLAR